MAIDQPTEVGKPIGLTSLFLPRLEWGQGGNPQAGWDPWPGELLVAQPCTTASDHAPWPVRHGGRPWFAATDDHPRRWP